MNYQKFEELQKTSSRFQTDSEKRNETLKRFGVGSGAVVGTALIMSDANALDVGAALTGNTASDNIDTAAIWVLGIAVTIFAARKVIGFFARFNRVSKVKLGVFEVFVCQCLRQCQAICHCQTALVM